MKRSHWNQAIEVEIALACRLWPGKLKNAQIEQLRTLIDLNQLSIAAGDVQLLEGKWYVTHSGLLRVAKKNRCTGIETGPLAEYSDSAAGRWVVKAIVYKTPRSKGFVGYGDADPTNVSPLVRGAELRMAETRAVNRALRKAYGVAATHLPSGENPNAPPCPRILGGEPSKLRMARM